MVDVELNVVDGYLDDTAQRNSCNKPDYISKDSMWIVLDLFLLHPSWACTVYQNTLHRFWVKKVKGMEESVFHEICTHSLFGKLTRICQFHVKSGQSYQQSQFKIWFSVARYVCGNFCYWYHVVQYYLLHLGVRSRHQRRKTHLNGVLFSKQDRGGPDLGDTL